ncbi:tyrosinase central domain-containing protein [Favolaschia claudopus]|uniref:Tyrosinase central domain-containing protein n=1 Tax=Favolaschia claudopus TaxID=2862362 RepID=A0AAW0DH27_9AGAR
MNPTTAHPLNQVKLIQGLTMHDMSDALRQYIRTLGRRTAKKLSHPKKTQYSERRLRSSPHMKIHSETPPIGPPFLPPELEQLIFEITADMYPKSIFNLLQVARRVHIWVQPLLFRVIRVNTHNKALTNILKTGKTDSKRPDHPYGQVRHLALESIHNCSVDEGGLILELCTNLVDLGLNSWFTDPALLPVLGTLQLRRLAVNLRVLFGQSPIDLRHPLFHSVTHLDIFRVEGVADILPKLSVLPSLTHLALDSDLPREKILGVLPGCEDLKVLLVQWRRFEKEGFATAKVPCVYDVRFVIAIYSDYWAEWENGARGREDSWSRADEFVLRKRKGEVEEMRYWIN